MNNKQVLLYVFGLLLIVHFATAQSIRVQPYLQDASPHSMHVLWETDTIAPSTVHWGLTEALGNIAYGDTLGTEGTALIHEVKLDSLERFTKYYYQVNIGTDSSKIYQFKTPPFSSDQQDFRLIAMSDMQKDWAFPDKYEEMVHEGILTYLSDNFEGDLVDNLALVMIPGDLVVSGAIYLQFKDYFFDPSHPLFSQVPVYPVRGNHENISPYFFQYFKLPENGTENYLEHWWYKDYGNVRMIGLDSNGAFANQEQLDWLEMTLAMTCQSDSIDFVFAQLHHPHKSELWTPGEKDFTGEVIDLLETFTTDCGKPSIHFFGHTHGYSRGNSRDHKHLWINVASAGGALDNWGEFPVFDYDEFSVSHDEYGFVSVEITNDEDPKFTVKRISRGDENTSLQNVITDSITIRLNASVVSTPSPLSPIEESLAPECVTLKASPFEAPSLMAEHGQSHWQVSTDKNDFSSPKAESWKNFENWFFDVDTQAGDDLSDERIFGLAENTEYFWRVRYRDRELNWSQWSEIVAFNTGTSNAPENLLINGGAEDNLEHWIITEGSVEALTDQECDGTTPLVGDYYFAVGGLCEESEVGRCLQNVDVSLYVDSIDAGNFPINFGGYLSDYSSFDVPEIKVIFLNEDSLKIGETASINSISSSWILLSQWDTIPPQTRIIQMELTGTRNAGTDNDCYFDELFLKIGTSAVDCIEMTAGINIPYAGEPIKVIPNPVRDRSQILLPTGNFENPKFYMTHLNGQKVETQIIEDGNRFFLEKGDLPSGTYILLLKDNGRLIGSTKIIVTQ